MDAFLGFCLGVLLLGAAAVLFAVAYYCYRASS